LAAGVFSMVVFQVFQSVGMATGIMPITGIPLPLVSYGGSSVLTTFICIGLVESVHMRRHEASS
jgi:rod shape determining protein RodA